MERDCDFNKLKGFCKVLENHDNLEALRLSYYENKNLTLSHFQAFMNALHNQKNLRKIDINLRWCDQVSDIWLKDIIGAAHHDTLESFELWICKFLSDN